MNKHAIHRIVISLLTTKIWWFFVSHKQKTRRFENETYFYRGVGIGNSYIICKLSNITKMQHKNRMWTNGNGVDAILL